MENRIQNLLQQMTLEEKLGQMNQLHDINDTHPEGIRRGHIGSLLNVSKIEVANQYQKIAVEESRLKIPLVLGRDVIHGFKTLFPIPLALSCTWNEALIEEGCHIAAKEAKASGYNWTFAPMIDVSRDPRWGRIAESLGEDPTLCARLGVAMIKGFQGDDPSAPDRVAACAKHFVGYGAAEGGRDYNTVVLHERQLRDTYLKPFKAAAEAGVATMMSAFNEINDIPASGNPFTLKQILRQEWGYDGMVVSDWASVVEMIPHGFAEDAKAAAMEAITAGVDMEMCSGAYRQHGEQLLAEGKISMVDIDTAVANILRLKFRLGLFENPYFKGDVDKVVLCEVHRESARVAARESMVLLKNSSALPLKKSQKIALIGPLCDRGIDQVGCWSMDANGADSITPKMAMEQSGLDYTYAQGLSEARSSDTSGIDEAVAIAQQADVAVLLVGEDALMSGESHSRAFIDLPGAQEVMIRRVAATGTPVVLVVMAGRPLTLGAVESLVDAVLWAWHPGTMAGPALLDLLYGDFSPSGRLTVTFPHTVGQIPVYHSVKNTGRPASNSHKGLPAGTPLNPVGFASYYLDVDFQGAYPFGYGLTYSSVEYGPVELLSPDVSQYGMIRARCSLTNTGSRDVMETVQLYIQDIKASVTRPVKELKDFQRVQLLAGESKQVCFDCPARLLAFHNRDMDYVVEPGEHRLWIATHSLAGEPVVFRVV